MEPVTPSATERMVFSVASTRVAGKRYRVDLLANAGAGWCSCQDWGCRRSPKLKAGFPILTRDTTCRHVRSALHFFVSDLLPRMAREMEGQR